MRPINEYRAFGLQPPAFSLQSSACCGDVWALTALGLMIVGLFAVNLVTGSYPIDPFWVEIARNHAPIKAFFAETVHSGKLPTWNPRLAMGYPFLAHSHGFFWYPPAWVFYFLPFLQAATIYKLFHLLLLGGGTYILIRTWSIKPFGSFAGAASMSLGGYAFENMGFLPLSTTYTWAPIAILVANLLMKEARLLWVVLLALVTLIQSLGGGMEVIFYQWVYISIAFGMVIYFEKKERGLSLRDYYPRLAAIGLSVLIGGLIALIQYLPLFEFFSLSDREAGWSGISIEGSFSQVALFKALMVFYPFVPLPTRGHYEGLGFVAIAFGILGWVKADRRTKWVIGALFIFCLINCQQYFSPFRWIISHFPIIKGFRFPMRLKFFLQLTACISAAFGVDYFIEYVKDKRLPPWLAPGLLIFGLAAVYGGAKLSGTATAGFAGLIFIMWITRLKLNTNKGIVTIMGILIVNLCLTSMTFMPRNPSNVLEAYPAMKKQLRENAGGPDAYSRSVVIAYKYNSRLIAGMEIAWKGHTVASPYSMAYRRYTWYYSLMVPRSVDFDDNYETITKIHPFYFHFQFYKGDYLEDEYMPWFDLAGVKYLYSRNQTPNIAGTPEDETAHFKRITHSEIDIYVNENAYPRAFIAGGVKVFDDFKSVFRFMRANPDFDFHNTVLLESDHASGVTGPMEEILPPDEGHPLPIINNIHVDEVNITSNISSPAYLVLTDVYVPGWRVFIDGREEKVVPADGAFRAVKLPSGESHVTFVYKPQPFRIGLWFSLASLMAVALLFITALRKFKKRPNHVEGVTRVT